MKTRDGRQVRIFCADGGGAFPVMGAHLKDGVWVHARWVLGGRGGNKSLDIHPDSLPEFQAAIEGGDFQSLVPISPRGASAIGSQHVAGSVPKKEPVSHSRSGASVRPVDGLPRTARDASIRGDSSERRQPSHDSARARFDGPRSFLEGA